MANRLLRVTGIALLISSVLVASIPTGSTEAVVLDAYQMNHGTLVKYEGTDITVSISDEVKAIGPEAFAGNQTLGQIDVGKNTSEIGQGAFSNCPYLRTVVTHDNLTDIGAAAFAGDTNLASIHIGDKLMSLGYGAFAGCKNLTSITISPNNQYFTISGAGLYSASGDTLYAYMGGASATYYKMPNSVNTMGKYTFWGNEHLDSVSISSYVEDIPAYAFSNCKNLKSVNIPYSVTTIGTKAFENCVSLADVSIPPSVTYIDPTAFDGCTKVNIIANPGTAGYAFAQSYNNSDVAYVENGDVNVVIYPDEDNQPAEESAENSNEDSSNNENTDTYNSFYASVDASNDPSNVEYMPKVDPLSLPDDSNVLAKTVVVGGNAVLFINPSQNVYEGYAASNNQAFADNSSNGNSLSTGVSSRGGDIVNELPVYDSSKGGYLPKYTEVSNKIATQAYYANQNMDGYLMPSNIEEIGDFAFARSNIKSLTIPNGTKRIGYAAFYHCNNLSDVTIPATVTEIDGAAFDNTPYLSNFKSDVSSGDFLIVGDGILLAYSGQNSSVTIPEGVKTIAPSAFAKHTEIVTVALPSSLTSIGDDAFRECTNLSSVTGGQNVRKIGDRAYMGCPITSAIVEASVGEMGLRAIDFSGTEKSDATKVVVFKGSSLPKVTSGNMSQRLSNDSYRQNSLYNVIFALVNDDVNEFENTVLDNKKLGFSGMILSKEHDSKGNETGKLNIKKNYIFSSDVLNSLPQSITIEGKDYTIKGTNEVEAPNYEGVNLQSVADVKTLYNNTILDNIKARFSESETVGNLYIDSSMEAKEKLTALYSELFGSDNTPNIEGYDIRLYDVTETVPIKKFGNSVLTIEMPIPAAVAGDTYHVITVDDDGQLEEVKARVDLNGENISFETNHLSYYGIYATSNNASKAIMKNGRTVTNYKKDASPDTGDISLPVKYVVSFGMFAAGLFCLLVKRKKYTIA